MTYGCCGSPGPPSTCPVTSRGRPQIAFAGPPAVSECELAARLRPRTYWMANSNEIVDQISSFALFADLQTPQLERVAHTFEERWYSEGERVLRQGLTGSD